jgi:hypothetical protein
MDQTINLPKQTRDGMAGLEIRANSFDDKAHTVDVIFSTGAKVRRYSWRDDGAIDEELSMDPKHVRLGRLNAGAAFLNSHDSYDLRSVLGSIVPRSAKIVDGIGVATVLLSKREEVAGIVQDIRDGVIRNTSVGYKVHEVQKNETDKGTVPLWRVIDWEPFEVSAVAIPADAGSRFRSEGRVVDDERFPCIVSRGEPVEEPVQRQAEVKHGFAAAARMRMRAALSRVA